MSLRSYWKRFMIRSVELRVKIRFFRANKTIQNILNNQLIKNKIKKRIFNYVVVETKDNKNVY